MTERLKARVLLDRYLSQVRAGLRGLPPEQVDEILRELGSHLQERAEERGGPDEQAMQDSIEALGEPEQIAGQYLTQNLFSRTAATRSPVLMAQTLFHWATLSLEGFAIASISLFLYLLGAGSITLAVAKLFRPDRVGVWVQVIPSEPEAHSISIGGVNGLASGHDLFGWWLVPLGLFIGLSLIIATYRIDLAFIARFRRRSHDLG